jgi:hypothetical protein
LNSDSIFYVFDLKVTAITKKLIYTAKHYEYIPIF